MDSEPPSHSYIVCASLTLAAPTIMISTVAPLVIAVCILLLCSALISGSEVAYFSLSPGDIQQLKSTDDPASARVLQLKRRPRQLLSTILISNNFVNIGVVLLSDSIVWSLLGENGFESLSLWLHDVLPIAQMSVSDYSRVLNFIVTVVGVTFLLLLFGEVAPKIYAKMNNMAFAKVMSRPLAVLMTIFSPINHLMVGMAQYVEKSFGVSSNSQEYKDDIEEAIEMTVVGNQHAEQEVDMLKSIVKFNEVTVKQIMRSRPDIIAEGDDSTLQEVMKTIQDSGYSRIPIYHEDLDSIIGLLYAKDLLGTPPDLDWTQVIHRDVFYVPESKRINEILKEFQQKHLHMAIVVDEYGGVSGLVTLEDVMEEVIGEITDEFDEGDDIDYVRLDDQTYIFDGKTLINDMCRVMNIEYEIFKEIKGDADSIAGVMLEHMGQMPRQYDEIELPGYNLRAERVNKRRIEKVKIQRIQ